MTAGTAEDNYAAALVIMGHSFRILLGKVAEQHNSQDGPWLDELQDELVLEAKGMITEGFSIQTDAAIVKFGIDVLQTTLDAFRRSLVVKD